MTVDEEHAMNAEMIAQSIPWAAITSPLPFLEFEATYVCGLLDVIGRSGLCEDIDTEPEDPNEFDPDWLMDCQDYADFLSLLDMTGCLDAWV